MAYLSLGSNLGDRKGYIQDAMTALVRDAGKIRKKSSLYKTEPVGKKNQPWFLNQCVKITTELPPEKFLKVCQNIEKSLGRERRVKWGPRTIDIDILFWGKTTFSPTYARLSRSASSDSRPLFLLRSGLGPTRPKPSLIKQHNLIIPHPRLHQRRFVLVPLAQIAPNFRHPILKKTVKELLKECRDSSRVVIASAARPRLGAAKQSGA